jgi:hypothetical protein
MLIESVQSVSASDGNLLDGIRDTLVRFVPYSSSITTGRSKMLPIWKILIPAVGLMTGRYICEKILYKIILPKLNAIQEADRYRKRKQRRIAQVNLKQQFLMNLISFFYSYQWMMIMKQKKMFCFLKQRMHH